MLIDTKREKDINLGTSYPFGTLPAGVCLVNSYQRTALQLEIGSKLTVDMGPSLTPSINVVIQNYNAIASQHNWEPV